MDRGVAGNEWVFLFSSMMYHVQSWEKLCRAAFWMTVFTALPWTVVHLVCPKATPFRCTMPAWLAFTFERFDEVFVLKILAFLLCDFMYSPWDTVHTSGMFICLGGFAGAVPFSVSCGRLGRKPTLLISHLLSMAMFIVLSSMTSGLMSQRYSMQLRGWHTHGHEGNRKIRAYVDPNFAKKFSGEVGAIPHDFQRLLLVLLFLGFAGSITAVAQVICLDAMKILKHARITNFAVCVFCWDWARSYAAFAAPACYILLDIDGSILFLLLPKLWSIFGLLLVPESKSFETSICESRSPCWMKALYVAYYYMPQGSFPVYNMIGSMLYSRWHLPSSHVGRLTHNGTSSSAGTLSLVEFALWFLHVPVVGAMFAATALGPNASALGVAMNMYFVRDYIGGWHSFLCVYPFSLYPTFVGQYVCKQDYPWVLGVVRAMVRVGLFMGDLGWPLQLHCGDPMNCWRSQYLYSHAAFYNINGNVGNATNAIWYLFAKSQRRQCCCPFRKLKPDCPDKCCPPCCLGPLVEEQGGCPCPCCCASCSI